MHPRLTQHERNMTTQNTYTIKSSNTTNNNASDTHSTTNDQETTQPPILGKTESTQDKQEARKSTNENNQPGTTTQRKTSTKTTSRTGRKRVLGKAEASQHLHEAYEKQPDYWPHMQLADDHAFEPPHTTLKRTKHTTDQTNTKHSRGIDIHRSSCQKQPDEWPRMRVKEDKSTNTTNHHNYTDQHKTQLQDNHCDNWLEDEKLWD